MKMSRKQFSARWLDDVFVETTSPLLRDLVLNKQPSNGLDLRGLVVGLDGEISMLMHRDFQETVLRDSDLSFGKFSCPFSHCQWSGVRLESVKFDTCRFKGASFTKCDFLQSQIRSPVLDDCLFTDCIFDGVEFSGRGAREYGGKRINFVRCRFLNTSFRNLQLRAGRFMECDFSKTLFDDCILTGSSFCGSVPSIDEFKTCELTQCLANGAAIFQSSQNQ
jgi:uncharacterized protein YjbI with pentapeptide repeats